MASLDRSSRRWGRSTVTRPETWRSGQEAGPASDPADWDRSNEPPGLGDGLS